MDYTAPGPGVRRAFYAVEALYAISQPFVGERVSEYLAEADRQLRQGRPLWLLIDCWLGRWG